MAHQHFPNHNTFIKELEKNRSQQNKQHTQSIAEIFPIYLLHVLVPILYMNTYTQLGGGFLYILLTLSQIHIYFAIIMC